MTPLTGGLPEGCGRGLGLGGAWVGVGNGQAYALHECRHRLSQRPGCYQRPGRSLVGDKAKRNRYGHWSWNSSGVPGPASHPQSVRWSRTRFYPGGRHVTAAGLPRTIRLSTWLGAATERPFLFRLSRQLRSLLGDRLTGDVIVRTGAVHHHNGPRLFPGSVNH